MNRLLLSALTLGCLSMALVYFSLQEPGEPETIAIQAMERAHKPSAADIRPHTMSQPTFQHSASPEAYPNLSGPRPNVYEI